jgi:hypothetical protein
VKKCARERERKRERGRYERERERDQDHERGKNTLRRKYLSQVFLHFRQHGRAAHKLSLLPLHDASHTMERGTGQPIDEERMNRENYQAERKSTHTNKHARIHTDTALTFTTASHYLLARDGVVVCNIVAFAGLWLLAARRRGSCGGTPGLVHGVAVWARLVLHARDHARLGSVHRCPRCTC